MRSRPQHFNGSDSDKRAVLVMVYQFIFGILCRSPAINVSGEDRARGKYFILWGIVDPRTESNPRSKPNPNPNCGFTISHKMKYLRSETILLIKRASVSEVVNFLDFR